MHSTHSAGQRMSAVVFEAPGKPEDVLRVRDIAVPQPASGEVLGRIVARPIQPSDLMFIAGRCRIRPALPQVAGLEGTGSIVAAGQVAHAGSQQRAQMVAALWRAMGDGAIALPVKARCALDRVLEAIATVRADSRAGKVLLCTPAAAQT